MSAVLPLHNASTVRSPLILACLAATWLVWDSTQLAIKWTLVSFPPLFQMGLMVAFIADSPAMVAPCQWPCGLRPSRCLHAAFTLPSRWEAAGIGLGLCGMTMLSRGQGCSACRPGLLAMVLACICRSIGSVRSRHGMPSARRRCQRRGAAGGG